MSCPHSAAVAANGDLYIADSANDVIRKVDHASGIITTVVGEGGKPGDDGDGGPATAAHLSGPKGIVFDANWNLLIADSGNDRIRRVDARTGVITTIAGTGETGVTGNGGPATAAQLSEPRTLAVAPDGSIYFTEPKENIVRKIDPNGIITLFAGTGKAGFSGDGGPADKAQLNFNRGVNVDGAGTVWIADSLNQRHPQGRRQRHHHHRRREREGLLLLQQQQLRRRRAGGGGGLRRSPGDGVRRCRQPLRGRHVQRADPPHRQLRRRRAPLHRTRADLAANYVPGGTRRAGSRP